MYHKRAPATGQGYAGRHLYTGQGLPYRLVQTELIAFVQGKFFGLPVAFCSSFQLKIVFFQLNLNRENSTVQIRNPNEVEDEEAILAQQIKHLRTEKYVRLKTVILAKLISLSVLPQSSSDQHAAVVQTNRLGRRSAEQCGHREFDDRTGSGRFSTLPNQSA